MNPTIKRALLLLLLTLFFLVDDALLFFFYVKLGFSPIDPLIFSLISTVVIALNLGLAMIVFRIMHKKPTTGPPGMIGEIGVVIKENSGGAWVRVHGEIWRAIDAEPLHYGDRVIVEKVEGLALVVKRVVPKS